MNGSEQNATVAVGVEHTFSCPVDGNPVPSITWYSENGTYNGKQFKTGQSGCYICVAKNIHGMSDNITQCLILSKFTFLVVQVYVMQLSLDFQTFSAVGPIFCIVNW